MKSNSKENSLSRNRRKYKLNNLKIIHKSNSLNANSNFINNNKNIFNKALPYISISKTPYGQSLSRDDRQSNPINSNISPKKEKDKDNENYSNIPTSKNNNESNRPSIKKIHTK